MTSWTQKGDFCHKAVELKDRSLQENSTKRYLVEINKTLDQAR